MCSLMKRNVIILTSGLSGSSVLAGLLARAGYWAGESTFKKPDYDTYENQELIELNKRLFQEAGYKGNYLLEFCPETLNAVARLHNETNTGPYVAFIDRCEEHSPWIWKDPRLWLTIRFWRKLLDVDKCGFVLLTRGSMQSWISSILRRQIISYRYSKRYEARISQSIEEVLAENKRPYVHVAYEELIQRPDQAIGRLNEYLGTTLTVDDLKAIYRKPLYRNPRSSLVKHMKALLIYLKNYSERLDIAGESE
jgi:hypothetical protein